VEACPAGALEVKGTARTVEAVLEEVEKDRAYYESSGGGLTLSGGEPTAQFEFCKALLVGARQARLHTCLETSALAGQDKLLRLNELVDLFLIDWKESDPDRHVEFTGASHDAIHRNIVALDEAGAKLLLRCPIVPGLNDRADHFRGIALLAGKLENVQGIEVMGYHPMGASKARNVGKQYPLPDVPQAQPQQVRAWREAISAHTSVKVF
jgi:pyruvate formate lyase activating enzyme